MSALRTCDVASCSRPGIRPWGGRRGLHRRRGCGGLGCRRLRLRLRRSSRHRCACWIGHCRYAMRRSLHGERLWRVFSRKLGTTAEAKLVMVLIIFCALGAGDHGLASKWADTMGSNCCLSSLPVTARLSTVSGLGQASRLRSINDSRRAGWPAISPVSCSGSAGHPSTAC